MNVSSIVIQTPPKFLDEVLATVKQSDFCDYHFHDEKGRIIVTVEGEGVEEEIAKLNKIQAIPHVVAADMMFAYSEEELDRERENLEVGGSVPEMLNDDSMDVKEIVYQGDLKKRF